MTWYSQRTGSVNYYQQDWKYFYHKGSITNPPPIMPPNY